ncbi:Odorant receptor 254 [Nylanderia fulva]|uniref:Odorant receptor n=1 Tax=Nylanderia fulva TaxID=613905 RepID=A0A6G1LP76_9HYME|nr:Odorant receptor 254 [Nylanderia fulva]
MIPTTSISPSLKIGLRLIGMWPGVPYSAVCWLTFMLNMLILQYFQYMYVINHFKMSELSNLVDSLPATLDFTLTFFKMIIFWIHRRVLHQIIIAMANDWRNCVNNEQHFYVMTIKANLSHFFYKTLLSFNTIVGILYYLGDYAIHFDHLVHHYNDSLLQLPIKIQFPFKYDQSPIFELLIVIVFLCVMFHMHAVTVLNGLFFTLVLHVSGQIEIICQEFKNISEKISLNDSSSLTLGELFSLVALMQVVWNTLVICCLGFMIVISINNGSGAMVVLKTAFGYIGIMFEVFIICFAGEYLSFKSISIANAAYDTLWYNVPPMQSKVITFIIMRSHRRLGITAGKMMDMSFETFSSIVRASASYVSVLHAMY